MNMNEQRQERLRFRKQYEEIYNSLGKEEINILDTVFLEIYEKMRQKRIVLEKQNDCYFELDLHLTIETNLVEFLKYWERENENGIHPELQLPHWNFVKDDDLLKLSVKGDDLLNVNDSRVNVKSF